MFFPANRARFSVLGTWRVFSVLSCRSTPLHLSPPCSLPTEAGPVDYINISLLFLFGFWLCFLSEESRQENEGREEGVVLCGSIMKHFFCLMRENTHTSPTHVRYPFLWNDSLLANVAGKGGGRYLKLIRKKKHLTCRRDINLLCLMLPKLFSMS